MIAAFIDAQRGAALPPEVAEAARWHFLDAIGVGLAASTVAHATDWAQAADSPGAASLLTGGTATPATAAMVNGALIHSLEYDDTHIASVIHGSAVAAPAALAAAQETGATGADLLTAFALAWEVMIRIGRAAPGAFQARGVQVTGIAGALGAATAAAYLGKLDPGRTRAALGIAGSEASGLLAFLSDGSSVKALHPGWAAQTGLRAVRLARAGMTGPADILDGRFGIMEVFAGTQGTLADQLATLGRDWHLPEAAFKLYPCCHYIHPFLEALETLIDQGLTPDRMTALTAHVPPAQAPLICEPWSRRQHPASGYDGKWGLAYCLALRLGEGRVDVASFEHPPRPETVALAQRMSWQPMEPSDFPARFPARIDVDTPDGPLTATIPNVRGAPDRPVPPADITAKFRANAARRLSPQAVAALETAILALGTSADLSALSAALASVDAVQPGSGDHPAH